MLNNKKKAACAAMLCMAMTAPFAALADEIRVVTCGTLNLRAEANTSAAVLGKYGWARRCWSRTSRATGPA